MNYVALVLVVLLAYLGYRHYDLWRYHRKVNYNLSVAKQRITELEALLADARSSRPREKHDVHLILMDPDERNVVRNMVIDSRRRPYYVISSGVRYACVSGDMGGFFIYRADTR
jgi:hypothetical protein